MLIIADLTESLPAAAEEAERLCLLLDEGRNLEISVVGGKQVRKIDLLQMLNHCDLVHYAGHAFFDAAVRALGRKLGLLSRKGKAREEGRQE